MSLAMVNLLLLRTQSRSSSGFSIRKSTEMANNLGANAEHRQIWTKKEKKIKARDEWRLLSFGWIHENWSSRRAKTTTTASVSFLFSRTQHTQPYLHIFIGFSYSLSRFALPPSPPQPHDYVFLSSFASLETYTHPREWRMCFARSSKSRVSDLLLLHAWNTKRVEVWSLFSLPPRSAVPPNPSPSPDSPITN